MRLKKWESNSLFLMMAGLVIAMMTIGLSVTGLSMKEKLRGKPSRTDPRHPRQGTSIWPLGGARNDFC